MKKKENNIITPKFISLLSLLLLTPYLSAQTRKIADYTVEDECGIVYCAVGDKEIPVAYLLGEQYVKAMQDLSKSSNSKTVVLPADVLNAIRGIMGKH